MEKIIVTIQYTDLNFAGDLEVAPATRVRDMVDVIARAMQWNQDLSNNLYTFDVFAPALQRLLDPDESLSQAGVWDGAVLIFHQVCKGKKPVIFRSPAPGEPTVPGTDKNTAGKSPLVGWRKTF